MITCLKIKNDQLLISGSADSTVKIWKFERSDSETNDETHKSTQLTITFTKTLVGHSSDVYCVDSVGSYIASGGADSLILIWNLDGDLFFKLAGHLGIVRCIYMDEHKLVTGGDAKKIMVWDYKVTLI